MESTTVNPNKIYDWRHSDANRSLWYSSPNGNIMVNCVSNSKDGCKCNWRHKEYVGEVYEFISSCENPVDVMEK